MGSFYGNVEKFEENMTTKLAILRSEDFGADVEAIVEIKATDEFAGELNVGDLIFADGGRTSPYRDPST